MDTEYYLLEEGMTPKQIIDKHIIVDIHKNPFFIVDLETITKSHIERNTLFPGSTTLFKVESCNKWIIIKLMELLGAGFICTSKYEISTIKMYNVDMDKVILNSPFNQEDDIEFAINNGVSVFTFENEYELYKLSKYKDIKLILRISVLDNKFGALIEDCHRILELAKKLKLLIVGVSFDLGNSYTDVLLFRRAIARVAIVYGLCYKLGHKPFIIEIGGDLESTKLSTTIEDTALVINSALYKYFSKDIDVVIDIGSSTISKAYTLAARIINKKQIDNTNIYYINDSVCGSFNYLLYDRSINVNPQPQRPVYNEYYQHSIIIGSGCNKHDIINDISMLPEMKIGDWLIFEKVPCKSLDKKTIIYILSNNMKKLLEIIKYNDTSFDESYKRVYESVSYKKETHV
ncbi:ornithine decarboxylases [NY_014 poxvirus]|uniref:ornithine decarboxylases n=1 Tax=NY_014 poxvirus TaxID=2025360 RepID=UPI000B9A027A|nr:ornithine decarboxylases [NY_014 poxvirus]AST09567.1 ornithine decarboxylases [NY_014 poxvirus]